MQNEISGVQCVIYNLHKSMKFEDTMSALNTLYEIIMNNNKEMNMFFKLGGSQLIMNYMRNDDKLQIICLKILANAAKKEERIRKRLQKSDIFYLLSMQLQKEKDFSRNTIILYATLIVILILGSEEAQNQMRKSGCLDFFTQILNYLMNEASTKSIPTRNMEILIYALATSIKDPQNLENQTQIGWILPKILDFVSKQTLFANVDQIHLLKCFWSFIRRLLDQNDINQKIFIKYPGAIVVFRSLQDILEDEKFEELEDLATKITGVLVKLKCQKEFLYQSSNYCSVTIMCSLLKTKNSLIIQNVVAFLNNLTLEIPQALNIITDKEILKGMKRARQILENSKTTDECCEGIWSRVGSLQDVKISSQGTCYESFESEDGNISLDTSSKIPSFFCTLHDVDLENDFRKKSPAKNLIADNQTFLSHLNFHKIQAREREKEKSLKAIVRRNPHHHGAVRRKMNVFRFLGSGVVKLIKKFWAVLFASDEESFCPWDKNCNISNDQLFQLHTIIKSKNIED